MSRYYWAEVPADFIRKGDRVRVNPDADPGRVDTVVDIEHNHGGGIELGLDDGTRVIFVDTAPVLREVMA